jgi:hypothetical protein
MLHVCLNMVHTYIILDTYICMCIYIGYIIIIIIYICVYDLEKMTKALILGRGTTHTYIYDYMIIHLYFPEIYGSVGVSENGGLHTHVYLSTVFRCFLWSISS